MSTLMRQVIFALFPLVRGLTSEVPKCNANGSRLLVMISGISCIG